MEEKHAIEVKDLVISYQNLKKTSIKKTLLHLKRQKPDRFVAVKGTSFYVREGEILGIKGYVDLDRFCNGTSLSDIEL